MTRTFVSRPARPSSTAPCPSEGTSTWWETWTQVGQSAVDFSAAAAARDALCPPSLQERTSTTSGSSAAAPGGGIAPCPCCRPTSPSPPAPPSASPTADSSTSSCARERSGSGSKARFLVTLQLEVVVLVTAGGGCLCHEGCNSAHASCNVRFWFCCLFMEMRK